MTRLDVGRVPVGTRSGMGLFALIRWLGLAGCEDSDYEIVPMYPTYEDAICLASAESGYSPPSGTDLRAGHSVAIWSTGSGIMSLDDFRWMAVGAPGQEADEDRGFVRVNFVDPASGMLAGARGYDRTFTPPSGAFYQFGWAMLASEIRGCYPGTNPGRSDGCGQELLVAAPDTATARTGGRVLYWESDGDQANGLLQYGGEVPQPPGLSSTAEFGYAMATARHPLDEEHPWQMGGSYPDWVAISAPGDELVHLYAVDPGDPIPLQWVQSISAPTTGRRFGHSLAVGDFDGDGWDDLAVGGPMETPTDPRGLVWVYAGTAGGTLPLEPTPSVTLDDAPFSPAPNDVTWFGYSLAAGPFVASADGDSLVVGAPKVDEPGRAPRNEDGGFCQISFRNGGGGLKLEIANCWRNGFATAMDSTTNTNEELGWAVSVGNFHNTDSLGGEDTDKARHPEVAVGRPGYQGDRGAVEVFVTNSSGVDTDLIWAPIEEWNWPLAGARFGSALAQGYVAESHWEDLAAGAPSRSASGRAFGAASLTKAVDTAGCLDINGIWEAKDFNGDPTRIKVWSETSSATGVSSTHILFLQKYPMALVENPGASSERICELEEDGGGTHPARLVVKRNTEIVIPTGWNCTSHSMPTTRVDFTSVIQGMGVDTSGAKVFADIGLSKLSPTELRLEFGKIEAELGVVTVDWESMLGFMGADSDQCVLVPSRPRLSNLNFGVCE